MTTHVVVLPAILPAILPMIIPRMLPNELSMMISMMLSRMLVEEVPAVPQHSQRAVEIERKTVHQWLSR